jgi:molecular chaperone Hsp33
VKDYLVRALAKEAGIRAFACVTTDLVNEARERHGTSPTATVALGRALTGGALLGALLRVGHRVAIKFEGSGPLEKIVVEADSHGRVRGYTARPEIDLPRLQEDYDVVSAIGHAGLLTVVKDVQLKELVEGVVHLETSDIDGDLTSYLEQSEQIPSAVQLGVILAEDGQVAVAGGLLFQSIPPQGVEAIAQIKERLQELPPVEALLETEQTPEEVLALIMGDTPYETLEQRPLRFECNCSRERTRRALLTLGREELEALLESEGEAVVECQFCHEHYVFAREELEQLIEETG